MSLHVAILKPEYIRMILEGRKAVESRLSKLRTPPFGVVREGERIFFKASGGPFMAMAFAEEVHHLADQTPADLDRLQHVWNPAVCGPAEYWMERRDRPFATFIRLRGVEPMSVGPAFKPQNMRAWYVLDESADPVTDVTLTAGAIRNHYLSLPVASAALRESPVSLQMPDGETVQTDFVEGGPMLRWRGWARYYAAFAVRPGDAVRFVALGSRRYRVRFVRRPSPA